MRNLFLTIFCILTLCACSREEGYTINGLLSGNAEGAKVTLISDTQETIDSATVSNGKFTLKGKIDAPGMHALIIDTNDPDAAEPDYRNKTCKVNFYLENSDITFEGNVDSLPTYYYNPERKGVAVIKGSASQDLYENFKASIKDISDQLSEIDNLYSTEYTMPELEGQDASARGIELVRQEYALRQQKDEATWRFIAENPASVVALDEASYIINGYQTAPTSAQIDSLLSILRPHWENTGRFDQLVANADIARSLAIGEPYIDLRLLNANGDTVRLSSLVPEGRFTMLEFWASWCGPCRGEIPHLAKVNSKYPDFKIISISVDSDDASWQKAMKEENMTWTQLRNPDGMDGDVRDRYNIYGVPTCLILDKSGRFYKSNMRGAYLDEFLDSAYNKSVDNK